MDSSEFEINKHDLQSKSFLLRGFIVLLFYISILVEF